MIWPRRMLILVVTCAMSLATAPAMRVSAETVWAEPELLSNEDGFAWFPESVDDPAGAVRFVWEESLPAGAGDEASAMGVTVVLSQREADGWSTPAPILVKDSYNAGRPILVSDGRYLHLIVRYVPPDRDVSNLAGIYHMRAPLGSDPTNARSWSVPQHLSQFAAYWADPIILADGSIVVLYNQITAVQVNGMQQQRSVIFSRRSTDDGATWEAPVRVSDGDLHAVRTSLAATPNGTTLIAAWDLGYDNLLGQGTASGLASAVSNDGGRSWSTPHTFLGEYQQSAVATDGDVTLLVYRSTVADQLIYRLSDDLGATWSDEADVPYAVARPYPGDHNFDKLSLAFDGDGSLLLAYVGGNAEAPRELSVFVISYSGGEWSQPEAVASPEGYPEYPRMSIALGNQIHIIYFVRDDPFDTQRSAIWVVSGQSDAQPLAASAIAPATAPVPTPVPATPLIQLATVPTQIPAPDPIPRSLARETNVRSAMRTPITLILAGTGAALIVVLGLYAAMSMFQRMQRR